MSTRVILSLAPASPEAALAACDPRADLLELRLDALSNPRPRELFGPRRPASIATCRPGALHPDPAERLALLTACLEAGADYVDLEWESWQQGLGHELPRERLIMSQHDVAPADLSAAAEQLSSVRPAVVKLVAEWSGPRDLMLHRELSLRLQAAGQACSIFASGAEAHASRILSALWGGWGCYACADPGQATAPGQPTLAQLDELYRLRELASETFAAVVVGHPLGHSLSPPLHNRAYRCLGLDGVYLPLPTRDAAAVAELVRSGLLRGASVTRPLKQDVAVCCQLLGPEATAAMAVNTLSRLEDGRLRGDNSDVLAIASALGAAGIDAASHVRVLGAGGTARAALVALRGQVSGLAVCARREQQARELAARLEVASLAWEQRGRPGWDWLVNTTPVGQQQDLSPFPAEQLGGEGVLDLVYVPERTRLLRDAAERGLRTVSGLEVFVRQAAEQIALWTGVRPQAELLRELLPAQPG